MLIANIYRLCYKYVYIYVLLFCADTSNGTHMISKQPDPTMIIYNLTQGKDFPSVRCDFTGDSAITITWQWEDENGDRQEPDYYFSIFGGTVQLGPTSYETTSSLTWDATLSLEEQKSAEGNLIASATHGGHTLTCNSITVDLQWPSATVNIIPSTEIKVNEGDEFNLTCSTADPGDPPGTVKWTKEGHDQSAYDNTKILVLTADKLHAGIWSCYYQNLLGSNSSDGVAVKVLWRPSKPDILGSSEIFVLKGEHFELKCDIRVDQKGNPQGTVVWTLNNSIKTEYDTDTLRIDNIIDTHLGLWRCYYTNNVGNGPASDPVKVSEGWLPSASLLYVNTASDPITLNSSITLNCSTTDKGNPPGNVVWNRDEYTEYTEEIIHIDSVTRSNTGTWSCYFKNTIGNGIEAVKYIDVKWNVSSDVALIGPMGNVMEGDIVTLNCTVSDFGSPEAIPTWYHNGTKQEGEMFNDFVVMFETIDLSHSGTWACSAGNIFSGTNNATYSLRVLPLPPPSGLQVWVYAVIAVVGGIVVIVIIVIIVVVTKKQNTRESDTVVEARSNDQYAYNNKSFDAKTGPGHYDASKTNVGAADPVYSAVSKGKPLTPIADGAVYSQVDLSKKTSRQSMKGLPMSKKAIGRIIFHKKDGYVNMTFQVRKKFTGDIEIGICRVGDQSCTSKVSKQHDGASKDVVMVLPIEDSSPDNYSIHIKFIERGQVTQTVDLTYPYNKNAVNVTVLNNVYGTNVSPSHADVEVEGVPSRPPRQGYPAEGVTYAVMDWDRSQAPGRPPRLSARSQAQEHVVYADVRPGGNVY